MNSYHWINGTEGFTAQAVNHFTAATNAEGTIVAIFNEKTKTVQVFDNEGFTKLGSFGYRIVKWTKATDARGVIALAW